MPKLDLFSDKSDLYAKARPQYPSSLFEFLATQVPTNIKAWDCATGNGQAALGLANYFREVYATDLSAQQIENSFKKDNITYSAQLAESTDFENESFDLITVAQALHWFDYEKFWPEALRVLKPNGIFAAWGYSWFQINPELDAILKTMLFDIIEPYWAAQNKIAWRKYIDINFPFETLQSPEFNMNTEWNYYQLMNYLHTWSATRRCMDALGKDFFENSKKAIATVWGDLETTRMIYMDVQIYVGRNS